jgi:hypothetical protein
MDDISKGFAVAWGLLLQTVPLLVWTLVIAACAAFLFGPRMIPATRKTAAVRLPWYRVHEFGRILSTVTAIAAFGSFQGYWVGSVAFQDAEKTIASLLAGAVTFLSTTIALLYAKDAPESFKRAVAPGIVSFLMCFLVFSAYRDRLTSGQIKEPLAAPQAVSPGDVRR